MTAGEALVPRTPQELASGRVVEPRDAMLAESGGASRWQMILDAGRGVRAASRC